MADFRHRIEFVENGTLITNRATNQKTSQPNSAKAGQMAQTFITEAISEGEPGVYYDIDITVTKRRISKPDVS
jgi:hypothetical protein